MVEENPSGINNELRKVFEQGPVHPDAPKPPAPQPSQMPPQSSVPQPKAEFKPITEEEARAMLFKPPAGQRTDLSDNQFVAGDVTLPSKGIPYGGLVPGGVIQVRPMSAREEKILAGTRGDMNKILDTLFQRCLVTNLPPDELLVGDGIYLFFVLRSNTYGNDYTFTIKCPSCSLKFTHKIDLSKLNVQTLPEGWTEPFFVDLPVSGKRLGLRMLRRKDEKFISQASERQYKNQVQEGDISYTYRLAKAIVSIDNNVVSDTDFLKVVHFVEGLHGKDSWQLREALENNDCGVDLRLSLDCPRCDSYMDELIPMTADFFRPRRNR